MMKWHIAFEVATFRRAVAVPARFNVPRQFSSTCSTRKILENPVEVEEFLSKPTWSVKSLLPTDEDIAQDNEVTPKQLHHLLRLSALPLPSSPEEESKMLRDLKAQLHFVREVQKIDTDGVDPMKSIRDESKHAQETEEISLETLKKALSEEEVVGLHYKRIRRRKDLQHDAVEAENWNVLGQAPNKAGRYFVVKG